MKRVSRLFALASVLTTLGVAGCASDDSADAASTGSATTNVDRPPQFVLLAFDGSLNLAFWEESRAFAKDANVKFTYFISGTYFIPDANKRQYVGPGGHGAGHSDIGFGGPSENVTTRYHELDLALSEGHELGSHANGHFDGSKWTDADWESEFQQFDTIFFGDGMGVAPHYTIFDKAESVGFRAPLLGYSTGLYSTLQRHGYAYDTSKTSSPTYWPTQSALGIWNFPLAQLHIVGTNKTTLSMDYNFYYAQSKGLPDAANKETYKTQMINTYMAYFEGNYFGNRAPVHIGHHFSKWNGGAYWESMQEVARRVCGLPEVKCVTYKELMAFTNANKSKIADFQAGNFTKMTRPPSSKPVDVGGELTADELAEVSAAHETCDEEEAAQ